MRRSVLLAVSVVLIVLVAGIGIIVIVSLFQEPACPSGEDSPTPVLVAKRWIPEGTSGAVIVKRRMHATATIPCGERKSGAIADPAELLGTVVVQDIFPGQQLTEEDFTSR